MNMDENRKRNANENEKERILTRNPDRIPRSWDIVAIVGLILDP